MIDSTVIYNIIECVAYEGCDESTTSFSNKERKEMYDFLCNLLKLNDKKKVQNFAEEYCKEIENLGCEFNSQEREVIIDTYIAGYRKALKNYV